MEDEDEGEHIRRHIPQGNSPYRRGLWAEAYEWVSWLLSIFGDLNELRIKGVNRRRGLKLSNWLWGMEGAVRRLILAAALAMDPKNIKDPKTRPAAGARPHNIDRRPVFRVFCVRRAGETPPIQPKLNGSAKAEPRAYGHIPYPSDPLLVLGEPRRGERRIARLRQPNPLDRRGRLSRRDPDYRGRPDADLRPANREPSSSSSRRATRNPPEAHTAHTIPASLRDWRRVEDEWEKVIPAPTLAARIFALQRIIADPEAAIARTAQRLLIIREQASALISEALPLLRPPKRARIPPLSDLSMLAARCHGAILRPDTS
jgi:hypothetical protein